MTYIPKVYKSSPDVLNVASGGSIAVASGGSITLASGATMPRSVTKIYPGAAGKAGATAGFSANNTGAALVPQSQSASTYVIPITGLKVGDTIVSYTVHGQIESAGGTATLDADMRKVTSGVAADYTDASIGAITQVSATADTLVAAAKTLAAAEVLASTEAVYILLTATTAGSTDIAVTSVEVVVTEA